MTSKERYKAFSITSKNITVYESFNWLSSVLYDHQWDVVLSCHKDGSIRGAWPYFKLKKYGFTKLTMPWLTPYVGPIIEYPEDLGNNRRTSFEKLVLEDLLNKIPPVDQLLFQPNPSFTNWLPFYWNGFTQTTRYTYTLPQKSFEEIQSGYKQNIKRELKKAKSKFTISESKNFQLLHEIKLSDFKMKNISMFYTQRFFERIGNFVLNSGNGKLLEAKNNNGETVASMLFIWDKHYLYYHTGAVVPKYRKTGVMSLLLDHGIALACEKSLQFNFEGSMVESIERYFASFGAEQLPYFTISKTTNKILSFIDILRT